ncbi:hypothetical protein SSX86_025224 [Deinandra increscens subsp. villosa]|uniref:VQ domain-containing protein n=1 Tax=Deinandra increscens subsp. villosa TaxID=3103831 RepID=A0AAP0GMS1_9ASTR
MDQITHSYSFSYASSSTSSSSSSNRPRKTFKLTRPSYSDSLHSVQKPTRKPITKPFIAPFPSTPSKVYNVSASSFKSVVRMLTSTPKFQSPSTRRLKDIAPPPLIMSTIPKPSIFPKPPPPPPRSDANRFITSNTPVMDYFGSLSPLGLTLSPARPCFDPFETVIMSPFALNLSPSSLSWCSSLLLSPVL